MVNIWMCILSKISFFIGLHTCQVVEEFPGNIHQQYVFIALMFEMKTSLFLFLNVASIGNHSISYGKKNATWPEGRIQILGISPSQSRVNLRVMFMGVIQHLGCKKCMQQFKYTHYTTHIFWNYWIMHSSNIKYIFQYIFMHITVLIAIYHAFKLQWICFLGPRKSRHTNTHTHTHIPPEKGDMTVKR